MNAELLGILVKVIILSCHKFRRRASPQYSTVGHFLHHPSEEFNISRYKPSLAMSGPTNT